MVIGPDLSVLRAVAATVLEASGDLPPATVTCDPTERVLPPVTLSPASPAMPRSDQEQLVRAVAGRLRWPLRDLAEGDGWSTTGRVEDVQVQTLAVPLPTGQVPVRASDVTTSEHADLLRALIDWSTTLPTGVQALEVSEVLDGPGQYAARLVVASDQVDLAPIGPRRQLDVAAAFEALGQSLTLALPPAAFGDDQ